MSGERENIVIGIAGHVSHGKTTLVKALTGVDTDSTKEERERQMTIEPGFTFLRLPSGRIVSIVDAPGHERFIKNMLRGISGCDLAILVVAASDGVMPQTVEHLRILELLGIRNGFTVISKVDLVDEELLSLLQEEIEDLTRGTFLEGQPTILFSSKTNQGLNEIVTTIDQKVGEMRGSKRDESGPFRFPIDRVFTVSGYGTVVTGTIVCGKVAKGERVMIYPGEKETVVRNIQVHRCWEKEAFAGQRAGINLANVKVEEISRGMVLAEPGSLHSTRVFFAKLTYLGPDLKPLRSGTLVKLYTGTTEVTAKVFLLDRDMVYPQESCYVLFRTIRNVCPRVFDSYVIRGLNPPATLGGGIVLDVGPERTPKGVKIDLNVLASIESRNMESIIEDWLLKSKSDLVSPEEIRRLYGLPLEKAEQVLEGLVKKGIVERVDRNLYAHGSRISLLEQKTLAQLAEFHKRNPHLGYASKEEIKSKIDPMIDERLFEFVIEKLLLKGSIEKSGANLRQRGFETSLTEKQKAICKAIEEACIKSGTRPLPIPELQDIKTHYGEKETLKMLNMLIKEGKIIRLKNGRLLHAKALGEIQTKVRDHIEKHGRLSIKDGIEELGIGRTQAIFILEYLDSIGFTIRLGDYRILKSSKCAQIPEIMHADSCK